MLLPRTWSWFSAVPILKMKVCIFQAHVVCRTLDESRLVLDQMMEENCAALKEARDKLMHLQMKIEDGEDETADV